MSDECGCYGQFKKKREWDGMHFVYGVCQELPKRRSMRIGKIRQAERAREERALFFALMS